MSLFTFVKSQLSILDVAQEYVRLKPAGTYHKGPCPFHSETDASFTVSPDRGIFYCFGCHTGGDVISFIAKAERLSQIEAVQHIIERFGIEVPQEILNRSPREAKQDKAHKDSYFALCDAMAQYCNEQLKRNPGSMQYLQNRGISDTEIEYFCIGYFPGTARNITKFSQEMSRQNILQKDLLAAGVLMQGNSAIYSPYEERIIFPIDDSLGRTCGFGGRIFRNGDTRAKYYNSKENPNFSKGKLLFGYTLAKKDMQLARTAYLVEGYTDVVAMVKYGYKNTVATLGTACTADHLKALARQVSTLFVLYDGDAAGQKAILRLAELCFEANLDLQILRLPKGEDPATFLENGGKLETLTAQARDIFSFFVASLGANFAQESLAGKLQVSKKIIDLLTRIADPFKRDLLLQQAAASLQVPLDTLRNQIGKTKTGQPTVSKEPEQPPSIGANALEQKALFAILHNASHLEDIVGEEDIVPIFSENARFYIVSLLNVAATTPPAERFNTLFSALNTEQQQAISAGITTEAEPGEAKKLLRQLRRQRYKEQVQHYKRAMIAAQKEQNSESYRALLTEFLALQQSMKAKGDL